MQNIFQYLFIFSEFEIDPVITCKVEPQSNVIETNSTELTSSNIFLIPINAKNEIDDIQLPSHPISESPVIIHTQENLNGHSTKSKLFFYIINSSYF